MAIYKVEAPNGKVLEVEGPEGASADQVKQFAAQNYYADPANAPKDYSLGEIVSKGFGRGAKRIGSTIGDVLPAMGASALGFDEYAKKQMQEAQASEENISRTMAPQYPSYKDVKGVGDAGKFVLETAFEQIPNLFGIIGTGGVGGVAGGIAAKTAAKKATEALTKKELKKQLSEQASARAAKKILSDINKSKAKGQAAGVFLGSYALNAPEVFQNIYEQTGDFEPLAASLAGIVNASLDSILPASIMKSFSKPGRASVVTEILQKSGMQPGLARRATSNILGGLGTEGLTEATQEAVSIAAEKFVQGHSAIFDSDDFDRMLEAGIKGAVAGGAFKGVASVPEHLREKALTKKASPEKQEEIIEETKLVDTTVTTPVATTQAATTTTEEVVEPQPSTEARDQEAANVLAQQAKVEQLQKDLDTQLLDEKSITQVMEKDLNTYFGGYTETERKQIRNDLKKLRSEVIKAKTLGRTAETDAANRKQTVINKVNPDQIGITPAMLESVGITADTVGQDMINYFTERPFSSKEVADFGKQAQAMLTKAKTDNNVEVITKFGNLKKALPKLRKEIENVRNRTAEYTAGTAGVSDGSVGVSDSITTESTVGPVGAPVVVDPNVAGTVESGTSGEPRSLTQRINALKARIKIDDPQSDIITELDNIVDEDPAGALNFVEQLESEYNITPAPTETVAKTPLPSDPSDLTLGKVKPKATEEVVETDTIMELRKKIQPVKPKEAAMKVNEPRLTIQLPKNANPIKDEDKKGVLEKDEEIPEVVPAKEITAEEKAESDITIVDLGGVPSRSFAMQQFDKLGNYIQGLPSVQSGTGKELVSFLSTLKDKAARIYMGFLSIPNKIELFGDQISGLRELQSFLELKANIIKQGREQVSVVLRYAEDLISKKYAQTPRGKQLVKEWNRVLLELSRQNIDPETIIADEKARQQLLQENPKAAEFVERYERLPQDLKDLGNQIVNDLRNKYKALLETMIEAYPEAEASLREEFVPLNYYLPMVRKGDYWFKYVTKDGEEGKASAESPFLRKKKKEQLRQEGATNFEDFAQSQRAEIRGAPPAAFVQRLKAKINSSKELSDEAKKIAIENIEEQYLTLFPEQSLRNQEAHRKGIPGYEEDILFAYASTAPKIVSSIANAKYNNKIVNTSDIISKEASNSDSALIRAIGTDTIKSLPFYLNPVAKGWAAMPAYLSYVWFIGGNISSAFVNLTQIPLIVMPFLQGEYGFDSSYKAILDAMKLYGAGGFEQNRGFLPDRTSAPFTINEKTGEKTYTGKNAKLFKEGGKYHNLFARAEETAALRRGIGYEITELQKNLGQEVGSGLKIKSKVEAGIGYVFQNSERINREITLIAAFNLARSKGASETDAIQKAIELTSKVHSHALPEVGPSMFQDGIGKVAFVFKRFAQAQIYLVSKLFNDVFNAKPKTEADKETRAIAAKQLIGVYGYSFLMAGIQGMPLYGGATVLASLLLDDDDEPFEPHTYVNAAVGDLAYRGPLSALLGIDISQRTGFRDLAFREDPARLEKIGASAYMMEVLGGPGYGVLRRFTEGVGMIADGDVGRGFERVTPTALGNVLKTVRYNTDGMTNKYGVPIIEGDPSMYESFMQIVGFSNIELAEAYTKANALKGPERKLLARKSKLLLKYYLARQAGDEDGVEDIQRDIDRFNSKAPKGFQLSRKTIQRSMKARDARLKDSVNGVFIGKKYDESLNDIYGIPD
jgi:hypothetical protein